MQQRFVVSLTEQVVHEIEMPDSFSSLPSVVKKAQALFTSKEYDSALLVKLLEEEPLLSANILKLVNSPYYGLTRNVTSIQHAVLLLGATVVRGIIMASVLKKSFPLNLTPYKITVDEFDKICILRTKVLAAWVQEEHLDISTLTSVAFLIESAKLITANEIIKKNLLEEFNALVDSEGVDYAEKRLFSFTSNEIAAKLFTQWNFNEEFVELIRDFSQAKTQEQKILQVLLELINSEAIMSNSSIKSAISLAKEYNLDEKKLETVVEKIIKEFE